MPLLSTTKVTEKKKTCLGFWKEEVEKLTDNEPMNGECYYAVFSGECFPAVPKADYDKLKEENKSLFCLLKFLCKDANIDFERLWKRVKPDKYRDYIGKVILTDCGESIPKETVRKVLDGRIKYLNKLLEEDEEGKRGATFAVVVELIGLKKQLLGDE